MASLPEGKSRGSVFSAAVHTIWLYMLSPYHYKYKEAASLKVIGLLYSCLLIARLLSRSRMLNWHLKLSIAMAFGNYLQQCMNNQ